MIVDMVVKYVIDMAKRVRRDTLRALLNLILDLAQLGTTASALPGR